MTAEDVSVAANAIGWSLYADDGRPIIASPDGVPMIVVSDAEIQTCTKAAERAVSHLSGRLNP